MQRQQIFGAAALSPEPAGGTEPNAAGAAETPGGTGRTEGAVISVVVLNFIRCSSSLVDLARVFWECLDLKPMQCKNLGLYLKTEKCVFLTHFGAFF